VVDAARARIEFDLDEDDTLVIRAPDSADDALLAELREWAWAIAAALREWRHAR
jgi:hypothetical protein